MSNFLNKIFGSKKVEVTPIVIEPVSNQELYTQTLENTIYLDSVIKTSESQYFNIKTRGSEKNKARKDFLKDQIEWYKIKLEEEKFLLSYYGVRLNRS
ncbi:MAG: hypothetical protein ACFFKA_00050 [Candidatus Thorarchaeota archaeon]